MPQNNSDQTSTGTPKDSTDSLSKPQEQHLRDAYLNLAKQYKIFTPVLPSEASRYFNLLSKEEQGLFNLLERDYGKDFALENFRQSRNEVDLLVGWDPESEQAYQERQEQGLEPNLSALSETLPSQQPTQPQLLPGPSKPSEPISQKSGLPKPQPSPKNLPEPQKL